MHLIVSNPSDQQQHVSTSCPQLFSGTPSTSLTRLGAAVSQPGSRHVLLLNYREFGY